jgi:hypothetical protein
MQFKYKIKLLQAPFYRRSLYILLAYTLLPILIIFFIFKDTFKNLYDYYRQWKLMQREKKRLEALVKPLSRKSS